MKIRNKALNISKDNRKSKIWDRVVLLFLSLLPISMGNIINKKIKIKWLIEKLPWYHQYSVWRLTYLN